MEKMAHNYKLHLDDACDGKNNNQKLTLNPMQRQTDFIEATVQITSSSSQEEM